MKSKTAPYSRGSGKFQYALAITCCTLALGVWAEAGYTWIGPAGGKWSEAANWMDTNTIYPAFKSGVAEGETDGGVHHLGNATIYWRAADSTYNGGTWLSGTGILAVHPNWGESVLGNAPDTPATNNFVTGSHTLF